KSDICISGFLLFLSYKHFLHFGVNHAGKRRSRGMSCSSSAGVKKEKDIAHVPVGRAGQVIVFADSIVRSGRSPPTWAQMLPSHFYLSVLFTRNFLHLAL